MKLTLLRHISQIFYSKNVKDVMLALCSSSGPLIFQDVVGHGYGFLGKQGSSISIHIKQHCHYIKHKRNACIPD